MWKRARTWLAILGETVRAVRADPVLLAPGLAIIVLALVTAYLAWRFI